MPAKMLAITECLFMTSNFIVAHMLIFFDLIFFDDCMVAGKQSSG
jgi:hypothetical protein